VAIVDAPPRAPSPPPPVNVFDFLIGDGTSTRAPEDDEDWESEAVEDLGDDDDSDNGGEDTPMSDTFEVNGFTYGNAPIASAFQYFESFASIPQPRKAESNVATPAPSKTHSRNISMDSTGQKKSQKRKRGHLEDIDTARSNDIAMTDAPPLHSGLTGGLNRLLSRPEFPPSPDLSGDAVGESPLSPLKRNRRRDDSHNREHRREKKPRRKSNSDTEDKKHKSSRAAAAAAATAAATATTAKDDKSSKPGRWERRRTTKRSASPPNTRAKAASPARNANGKPLKAIEYPNSQLPSKGQSQELVKYSQTSMEIERRPVVSKSVDLFLTSLARGSDSDEGVSLHKALKRWRRDGGSGEKELWKMLKVRANDRGELIICI
jgi:cell growth-regulating nucleolar protein